MSASESSWISDRSLVRKADGNAEGLEVVTTTLLEVSIKSVCYSISHRTGNTFVLSATDIAFN